MQITHDFSSCVRSASQERAVVIKISGRKNNLKIKLIQMKIEARSVLLVLRLLIHFNNPSIANKSFLYNFSS